MKYGYEEGDVCNRNGCQGIIELREVEGCSCHIRPPCGACTTPRERCSECDYEAKNDLIEDGNIANVNPKTQIYNCYEPRVLDSSKIDYRISSHSSCSQLCEGVYPAGTTPAEVEAKVKGTFGGRFEYFGNGRFRYVAYTD